MQYIGKRVSIKEKEDELSIVIISPSSKTKNLFLFIWFFLWTLSGVIIFSEYFLQTDKNTKAAIIVWLGFWAYFEYKIFKTYLWRKSGKEKIKVREQKVLYKLEIAGKGKIKTYEFDFIKDLRKIDIDENSFLQSVSNSYWTIGGEKLTFDYYGKEIKLGLQLDENESKELLKLIKNKISSSNQ